MSRSRFWSNPVTTKLKICPINRKAQFSWQSRVNRQTSKAKVDSAWAREVKICWVMVAEGISANYFVRCADLNERWRITRFWVLAQAKSAGNLNAFQ